MSLFGHPPLRFSARLHNKHILERQNIFRRHLLKRLREVKNQNVRTPLKMLTSIFFECSEKWLDRRHHIITRAQKTTNMIYAGLDSLINGLMKYLKYYHTILHKII